MHNSLTLKSGWPAQYQTDPRPGDTVAIARGITALYLLSDAWLLYESEKESMLQLVMSPCRNIGEGRTFLCRAVRNTNAVQQKGNCSQWRTSRRTAIQGDGLHSIVAQGAIFAIEDS